MVKLLFGVFAAVFLVLGLLAIGISTSLVGGGAPSRDAQQDIPPQLLAVYQTASDSCPGLPWSVLAAIGKVETNHGRLQAPGVTSGANFAGAAGPMQIGVGGKAGNTFAAYAVDADGGGPDVYNPVDASFTAANYLCQNGANKGADVAGAIFAYNHADWYVTKVLAIASTYAASQGLPAGAPAEEVAAAAVQFAYSELGKPYKWGATGELGFYDCSGLMLRAYQKGGITLPRTSREQWKYGARVWQVSQMLPGDLVFYAYNTADPATIHHVGIYIGAGNMIDAPYTGANVRITPFLRGDFIGAVRPTAGVATSAEATTTTVPAN
ncbi:MAG TPA: bifunctional lytic transglycosylase/C40 family peptidase [Actinomycetes bacterium]|nr:bifunctional lytic transglycosylase/C40 family peptidase [Actinomycetes bacterium]